MFEVSRNLSSGYGRVLIIEQELSSDSIACLDELKGGMQCKVGRFDI